MIRIFISTILYFITMLTQAQEIGERRNSIDNNSSINFTEENCRASYSTEGFDTYRFTEAKFEVKKKDLTFDIKL